MTHISNVTCLLCIHFIHPILATSHQHLTDYQEHACTFASILALGLSSDCFRYMPDRHSYDDMLYIHFTCAYASRVRDQVSSTHIVNIHIHTHGIMPLTHATHGNPYTMYATHKHTQVATYVSQKNNTDGIFCCRAAAGVKLRHMCKTRLASAAAAGRAAYTILCENVNT